MTFKNKDRLFQNAIDNIIDDGVGEVYFCKKRLRNNKTFILFIAEKIGYGSVILDASKRLKNDKDTVLRCIKHYEIKDCNIMSIISDKLKNDKKVVKAIVNLNPDELEYAVDKFKDDEEVLTTAFNSNQFVCTCDDGFYYAGDSIYLEYASERLKDDKSFVLKAVKMNGWAFMYASDRIKDDKEIFLEALKSQHCSYTDVYGIYEYASDRLKNDKDIIEIISKHNKENQCFLRDHFAISRDDKTVNEMNTSDDPYLPFLED